MNKMFNSIIVLMVFSLFGLNCTKAGDTTDYNKVVEYEKGKVIKFPEFTLEYLDERSEKKDFPNGNSITFKFFDFKLTSEKETKVISWSFGSGHIAPVDFEFEGKKYQIEMSNSEALKQRLKKNEIVIVKK
jgi:hypothetical protein